MTAIRRIIIGGTLVALLITGTGMATANTISGTISSVPSGGYAREGICLHAKLVSDGSIVSSTAAAADGSFTIDVADLTDPMTVVSDAQAFGCSQQPLAEASSAPVTTLGTAVNGDVTGANLAIAAEAPRTISGTVRDATPTVVAGACVALYLGANWVANATTEPTGRYLFPDPSNGTTYTVQVSTAGDSCGNLPFAPYTSGAITVADPTNPVVADVTLTAGSDLDGIVSLPGGGNGADMCVRAFLGPDYASSSSEVRTGSDGRYTIYGLAAGTYGVQVLDCDGTRNVLPSFQENIVVAAATTVSLDVATRAGGVINGTVLVDPGQSAAGCAYAYLAGETDLAQAWGHATITAGGAFSFDHLDGETFDFHIVRGGVCLATPVVVGTWFRTATSAAAGTIAAVSPSFVTPAPAPTPSPTPTPAPSSTPAASAPAATPAVSSGRGGGSLPGGSASAAGSAAKIRFTASAPGSIRSAGTAGGKAVCSGSGAVKKPGVATVTCKLNAAGNALRKKGPLVVTVTTTFTPKGKPPITGTSTVTFPRKK